MLVVRLTDDPDSLRPTLKQRIVRLLEETYVGEILLGKVDSIPRFSTPTCFGRQDGDKEAVKFISDEMVDASM